MDWFLRLISYLSFIGKKYDKDANRNRASQKEEFAFSLPKPLKAASLITHSSCSQKESWFRKIPKEWKLINDFSFSVSHVRWRQVPAPAQGIFHWIWSFSKENRRTEFGHAVLLSKCFTAASLCHSLVISHGNIHTQIIQAFCTAQKSWRPTEFRLGTINQNILLHSMTAQRVKIKNYRICDSLFFPTYVHAQECSYCTVSDADSKMILVQLKVCLRSSKSCDPK